MDNKPAILYLLTSLDTTGGTVSKIKSTLKYTKYKIFVGAHYVPENNYFLNSWKEEKNVTIINLPSREKIFFKSVLVLNKIVKKENIKIIHSFFPNEMFVAYCLKILNPKLKIIRSFEGNVKRSNSIRFLSKIILPHFDRVIFISKYVRDFYSDITKRCKNKLIIDNAGYHICKYKNRNMSKECNIVSVAGLNKMKNVFMYAEIGRVLASRKFPFKIKIVGYGPLEDELKERIIKYEIEDSVTLLGRQNKPESYYEEADIYIHPADKEGFGITVAEAMSSGLPVIVSDKGGVSELVKNMEDGIIVDAHNPEKWADAIITLHNNRDLYKKLSQNGHTTYKNRFTPEIYARNLDTIYDELI